MHDDERRVMQFLAAIAHELRNPFQALAAGIALVKLGHTTPGSIATMEKQMEHIKRLLDDIQDVTLLEQGRLNLRLELLDVRDLTVRAMEATRSRILGEDRDLTVKLPPEPVLVRGDGDRLQQVLCNLIINACKYSAKATAIDLTVERTHDHVVFAVVDRGRGLTEEEIPRVFDIFEQIGERPGGQGGLGIGLTLVQQLVECHGGSVAVASEGRGRGSTFTVRLPIADELRDRSG